MLFIFLANGEYLKMVDRKYENYHYNVAAAAGIAIGLDSLIGMDIPLMTGFGKTV